MLTTILAVLLLQTPDSGAWKSLAALVGDWVGAGTGAPGEGKGGFSFAFDLQKKILIRRNYAEYAGSRHDDLMIIYREPSDGPVRADYYDNEGHIIRYTATSPDNRIVFISDPSPNAPRFRFTYTIAKPDELKIDFEIAPPGSPDAFKPYIQATARRKPR